ncbi:MAG: DUF4363 family protein [Oscillospiraceae bacterium]|nr:DUF4363 family protein [Oscillospiraceae bacterium]
MLKEILIVCFIILAILVCNFVLQSYITKSSDSLVEKLSTLSDKITTNSKDIKYNKDINNLINDVESEWEKSKKKWEIFVMHSEIDQIEIAFTNIKSSVKIDYSENAAVETEKAKFLLQHIAERDAFKLKNLF